MQNTRTELSAHVGGAPNAVQRRLIDRAAVLSLRIALFDARTGDGEMSEAVSKTYLAWSNSLCRTLAQLGLRASPTARPSLAEHLALKATAAKGGTA